MRPIPRASLKRREIVTVVFVVLCCVAAALTLSHWLRDEEKAAPPRLDLARHLRSHVADFPREGGYRPPTRAERAHLRAGVALVLDGRPEAARKPLAAVGYTARTVRLAGTERLVAQVTEERATRRGWGEAYVDLGAPVWWSAQVPHPVSDLRSERVGAELFRRAPGGVLVVAGARRDAGKGDIADMAHRNDSAFDAICTLLTMRRIPGIQLHGFADESAPESDVVISPGAGDAGAVIKEAARTVAGAGFEVCRAWRRDCGALEGTTNTQGEVAARHAVPFLHVEISHSVRDSAADRSRLAAALAEVAGRLPRHPGRAASG
ncbi:hypothetical protein [Streptomyces sp. NPDC057702]|uniref:hypothetical protein n=1 Tax=Streptomyces sp. NPDC057702 TaxID=3346221 RepID=UPI0036852525